MTLTAAAFVQLAAACGPAVHVETLASVARAESGFDPLTVHDNSTGRTYRPRSAGEAVTLVGDLIVTKRHSVDLGLMQVNSANLAGLGLSIPDAFDPCKNIAAGARVLVAGYQVPTMGMNAQPALLRALSRYNTGRADRGFANGYVARVQLAADQIVPAIRLAGSSAPIAGAGEGDTSPPPAPPSPPSWDVYARARYLRANPGAGAALAQDQVPPPASSSARTAAAPAAPVQLQAIDGSPASDR